MCGCVVRVGRVEEDRETEAVREGENTVCDWRLCVREVGNIYNFCTSVRVTVVCATEFCCELDTLTVAQGMVTLRPNSLWLAVNTQNVSYNSDFPLLLLVCESWRLHSIHFEICFSEELF